MSAEDEIRDALDPLTGQTVGPVRLLAKLDRSPRSNLWFAHHELHGDVLASILPSISVDVSRERFAEVRRALAAVDHPSFLRILGSVEVGDREVLISEFAAGGSLEDEVKRAGGRLPARRALEIGRDVISALAALPPEFPRNRRISGGSYDGFYWRWALEPEAIFFDRSGRVRLSLLGELLFQSLSCSGEIIRPMLLLSPEQVRGMSFAQHPEAAPKGDVYLVGAFLYRELSGGKLPYAVTKHLDFIKALLNDDPTPLREHAPEVPAPVEHFVGWLMTKDWQKRPGPTEALATLQTLL